MRTTTCSQNATGWTCPTAWVMWTWGRVLTQSEPIHLSIFGRDGQFQAVEVFGVQVMVPGNQMDGHRKVADPFRIWVPSSPRSVFRSCNKSPNHDSLDIVCLGDEASRWRSEVLDSGQARHARKVPDFQVHVGHKQRRGVRSISDPSRKRSSTMPPSSIRTVIPVPSSPTIAGPAAPKSACSRWWPEGSPQTAGKTTVTISLRQRWPWFGLGCVQR